MIPILEPYLDSREKETVMEAVLSGWISSSGKFVSEFEEKFSDLYRSKRFVTSVSNGTVALELALRSLNIGTGNKVLVPTFTFGASVNAILNVGAEAVFFEPCATSWNIDVELFQDTRVLDDIDAIILVSMYGVAINQEVYHTIRAKFPDIAIIEDCAESFGTFYGDNFTGSLADIATFSFFGNKTITTGEGGMVTFKDKECYLRAVNIKNHGMSPHKKYHHLIVGSNYRMTNIQAALGVAQLEKIEYIFNRKREITLNYIENLKDVIFQKGSGNSSNIIWLNTVLFQSQYVRDRVANNLFANGVDYRLPFSPMQHQPAFSEIEIRGPQGVANSIYTLGLSIPSSVTLDKKSQQYVIDKINEVV
jgi:perosamine synthetase